MFKRIIESDEYDNCLAEASSLESHHTNLREAPLNNGSTFSSSKSEFKEPGGLRGG